MSAQLTFSFFLMSTKQCKQGILNKNKWRKSRGVTMAREINYQNEAYAAIKNLILKSQLIPGQKISKNELVDLLDIGDTPVREAILLLKNEGLFHVIPQSGTYVSKINLQEVFEAKFVRENIEKIVFAEVCTQITQEQLQELEKKVKIQRIYFEANDQEMYFKLDEEFHRYFYEITNKLFVWQWIQSINISFNRCRYLRLEVKELKWQDILEEHEKMIELIRQGKKQALIELAVAHMERIHHDVKIILQQFPDYFEGNPNE